MTISLRSNEVGIFLVCHSPRYHSGWIDIKGEFITVHRNITDPSIKYYFNSRRWAISVLKKKYNTKLIEKNKWEVTPKNG